MDSFQIIVLVVATVLLIIIFATMGIVTKYYASDNVVFPPIANKCPDNWAVDASNNCAIPMSADTNVGSIYSGASIILTSNTGAGTTFIPGTDTPGYNSANKSIDFSDTANWGYGTKSPICNKNTWAKKYGIAWDGVSNVIGCK